MTSDTSWKLGRPGSLMDKVYDGLRKRLNHYLVGYLNGFVRQRQGRVIVEAGSGTGYASSVMAQQPGVRLSIALDHDIEALSQARQRDSGLPLVVADLCALPLKAESVDLIWNSSTLEHLPDPILAIAEMQRVSRADGFVFIGVPYAYGPLGFQRWIANTTVGVWIGTVFDAATLRFLILDGGFQPIGSLVYFFRFFVGVIGQKSRVNHSEIALS